MLLTWSAAIVFGSYENARHTNNGLPSLTTVYNTDTPRRTVVRIPDDKLEILS